MIVWFVVGAVALFGLGAAIVARKRRGERPRLPPSEPAFAATESTPPSSDGAQSAVRCGSRREQRAVELYERAETGLCLYCDKHASHQVPEVRLIRSALDPLYRRLNVVPVNRWAIVLHHSVDDPFLLCEAHHAIARSHLERRMADNQVEYAAFVEKQRHAMYAYTTYELDERMLSDAQQIRRGRSKSDKPATTKKL